MLNLIKAFSITTAVTVVFMIGLSFCVTYFMNPVCEYDVNDDVLGPNHTVTNK